MQIKFSYHKFAWAVFFAVFIITSFVSMRRAQKGSNDFDTFYHAGRSVYTGQALYYSGDYYEEASERGPFLYSPFAACLFALIAWMPLKAAAFSWNALIFAFFGGSLWLVQRLLFSGRTDTSRVLTMTHWIDRLILLIFAAALFLDNVTMAQVNVVVFFLSLGSLWLWQKGHAWKGGMMLAAAVMIKMTPAFLLLYFLVKKQGRVLIGAGIAFILATFVIPTVMFGFENNRLYHRQWLGRTVKPLVIEVQAHFETEKEHPLKKSAEMFRHNRLTGQLVQKNQSFEAFLTRLLLKERVRYGYEPYPIYVARKYEKLPVLFGGIDRHLLTPLIRMLELGMVLLVIFLWRRPWRGKMEREDLWDWALIFLSMTLFAPWARSHQFICWLFPLALIYREAALNKEPFSYYFIWGFRLSAAFYFLQAVPYGKAAGLGGWANLLLWFVAFSGRLRKPVTVEIH